MLNNINNYMDGKLSNSSNKIESAIVTGYVTTVLHIATAGLPIDPPTR